MKMAFICDKLYLKSISRLRKRNHLENLHYVTVSIYFGRIRINCTNILVNVNVHYNSLIEVNYFLFI